jgi:hypothetical protein
MLLVYVMYVAFMVGGARILGRISPCKQREPAEHPDHEQIDKTDKHER